MESPQSSSKAIMFSAIVVGVVILLATLSKWSQNPRQYPRIFIKKIKSMVEQANRWNAMSRQDTQPLIQLIHCNYALCYVQIARSLANDIDIQSITGTDIGELHDYLEQCQNTAIQNIGIMAPTLKIDGGFLIDGFL